MFTHQLGQSVLDPRSHSQSQHGLVFQRPKIHRSCTMTRRTCSLANVTRNLRSRNLAICKAEVIDAEAESIEPADQSKRQAEASNGEVIEDDVVDDGEEAGEEVEMTQEEFEFLMDQPEVSFEIILFPIFPPTQKPSFVSQHAHQFRV